MTKALVVVGNSIKYNQIFMEYLKREVSNKIGCIDAVYYLDKSDSDLFLIIEEIIARSKLVVIASKNGYNLIGKILSTISDDNMVLKDDKLVPSRSIEYKSNSYLIEYNSTKINAIKIDPKSKLPDILIKSNKRVINFFLFDLKEERYKELLEELRKIYGVYIDRTMIVDGLEYCQAEGFLYDQQEAFIQALAFGLKDHILFGSDLAEILGKRLIESGKKVTMMESCTGGLIASEFTKYSGVSSIFNGSIVSYSNEVKIKLGVEESTIIEHGAVSLQTVHEMLDSALRTMASDMAIAVSGVAGPSGGTLNKPVGTVYVGAKSKGAETLIEKLSLNGDRIYIQKQSMIWAFKLLALCDKKTFFNFSLKSLDN